ncbi:MAG: hypothetical protein JWQ43_1318 [Glaciihabitans sp.]|nr:hypothetical protein [Glaciihabitans sp.]
MRLWLKDSERRPDPAPLKTDDRTAFLVGMALWLIALVAVVVFVAPLDTHGFSWWLGTCLIGLVLGVAALVYSKRRRR